jgi:Photosynthetic reaction centre cytochrome C subunit
MTRLLIAVSIAATAPLWSHAAAQQLPPPAAGDTMAASRRIDFQRVLESIKGREQQPAESVFKDIQLFKGVPAGRLPLIMEIGFSRSLGVGCGHCHVVGEWERSDSVTKAIAREMAKMDRTLSSEVLPKIQGLRSERPAVNCTTCHRGQRKPALDLAPAASPVRSPPTSRRSTRAQSKAGGGSQLGPPLYPGRRFHTTSWMA